MELRDGAHPLEPALEAVLQDLLAAEQELSRATFRAHHVREAANSLQALVGPARAAEIAEKVGIPLPVRRVQGGGNMDLAARRALERRMATNAEAGRGRALRDAIREVQEGDADRARVEAESVASERHRLGVVSAHRQPVDAAPARDGVEIDVTSVIEGGHQVEDVSSTDRVVQLLREHEGKAIPRAMILAEFERRGWVDPNWSHPGPAIRMAIRRATEKGAAKLVGDGRYMYADPGLLGDLPSGGDA